MLDKITVQGTVADGFEEVRDEFTAFLAEEPADPGAQLAAYVNGQQVVDLWAGGEVTGSSLTGTYSSIKGRGSPGGGAAGVGRRARPRGHGG